MSEAKHVIIWGANPLGATRAAATTRNILNAQERGAKLVDVGLLYDATAAKADQFVPD
jgi:anaerobic selenocysteine-containing dehydrogenase